MESSESGILIILAIIGFIWLLPFITIIFSSKTSGREKLAWLLAVIFISWFAWIFYLLLAPIRKKN
jgi:O-antigen/teichoic acid export membrane protein